MSCCTSCMTALGMHNATRKISAAPRTPAGAAPCRPSFELTAEETKQVVQIPSVVQHSRRQSVSYTVRYRERELGSDFDLDEETVLGMGLTGPVRQAINRESQKRYAIKNLSKQALTQRKKSDLKREVEVYLSLDHPHVARLEFVYEEEREIRLVMELLEGGEVFDRLVSKGQYTEEDAANAVFQMLMSVSYLHSRGLIHRDIKLSNFLYEKMEGGDREKLKLIDFGFTKYWDGSKDLLTKACGTPDFVAPEVLNRAYNAKADTWSIGVSVYMLLTGAAPFAGRTPAQIIDRIKSHDLTWDPKFFKLSQEAQCFVKSLLEFDPEKRPSAAQALEDGWIKDRKRIAGKKLDKSILQGLRRFADASSFRRVVLSMMAWSLDAEDHEDLKKQFLELDKDNNGTIKVIDFKDALKRSFFVNGREAERLFEQIDADHDEEIAYSEFLAAALASRIDMHDDLLRAVFGRFEADESGYITVDGLREVLGDGSFDGKDLDDLLAEVDTEGKGQVSCDQFLAWMQGSTLHEEAKGDIPQEKRRSLLDSLLTACQGSLHRTGGETRPRANTNLSNLSSASICSMASTGQRFAHFSRKDNFRKAGLRPIATAPGALNKLS